MRQQKLAAVTYSGPRRPCCGAEERRATEASRHRGVLLLPRMNADETTEEKWFSFPALRNSDSPRGAAGEARLCVSMSLWLPLFRCRDDTYPPRALVGARMPARRGRAERG